MKKFIQKLKHNNHLKLFFVILIVIIITPLLQFLGHVDKADGWQGLWRTQWQGGGAEMLLKREGNKIHGRYQPYNGTIEGTIEGHLIQGQWQQQGMHGDVVFNLSPDGQSFFGRFDNGQWWNGTKISNASEFPHLEVDNTSPRESLRSLLNGFNALLSGQYYAAHTSLRALHFQQDKLTERDKFLLAKKYFYLLDQFTFKVWDVALTPKSSPYTFSLASNRLNDALVLEFVKIKDKWLLTVPHEKTLDAFYNKHHLNYQFLVDNQYSFLQLRTPRDTMRTFIEIMNKQKFDGINVTDTFELAQTDREFHGEIIAEYLKHTMDKISMVTYQEIPNNPHRTIPYVFFHHVMGEISIVAIETEDAGRQWRFSRKTLGNIRTLYQTFDDIPVVKELQGKTDSVLLFKIRAFISQMTPLLVESTLGIENWQWLSLPFVLFLSVVLMNICRQLPIKLFQRLLPNKIPETEISLFVLPLTAITLSLLWIMVLTFIGVNEQLANLSTSLGMIIIAFSGLRIAFLGINLLRELFFNHNTAFQGTNKIYATLFIGLLKIIGSFIAFFICSDAIGIPMETIVAGLGIFGLAVAFAARETIGNLFGSVIVLLDRPFKAGDFVKVGDIQGEVEMVGIRSTRMRTTDDTQMIIPNGLFSRESVENTTEKSCRHGLFTCHILINTPIEPLENSLEKIKGLLENDDAIIEGFFVGLTNLTSSGLELTIKYRSSLIDESEFALHKHNLLCNIMSILEQGQIKIAQNNTVKDSEL